MSKAHQDAPPQRCPWAPRAGVWAVRAPAWLPVQLACGSAGRHACMCSTSEVCLGVSAAFICSRWSARRYIAHRLFTSRGTHRTMRIAPSTMTISPSVTEKPTAMNMANCRLVALP